MKRRSNSQRGSVVVESASISLVLLMLLIGIFDFAQMLFTHQALMERLRGAARWGAISDPTNTTAITNLVLYNQTTTPSPANGYFGLTSSNVQVSRDGTAATDTDRLTVTIVSPPFKILSPFVAGNRTGQSLRVSVPLGRFN